MITALFYIYSFFIWPTGISTPQQNVTDIPVRNLTNDSTATLKEMSGDRGLVLIFYADKCPYNGYYNERIHHLKTSYEGRGILFVRMYTSKKKPQSIGPQLALWDEEQKVMGLLGARKTPEVFLFAKKYNGLEVVYHGAIDNNPLDAKNVSIRYLEEAIENTLNNKKHRHISTTPYGCYLQ